MFKSQRGFGLVDAMAGIMLLAIVGAVFAALFPTSFTSLAQAREYRAGALLAQRKMEQLRAIGYESLTQPLLRAGGIIDASPTSSPYSFTETDNVAEQLPRGTGTLSITDITDDRRLVTVTVSWTGHNGVKREVRLTSLFADRRTRTSND
ncbi:MAG: hypothetical protein QHI38_08420 [Armatimonadota bacterium]|nr:hypothetical protein [Armatimonadota bacterium]